MLYRTGQVMDKERQSIFEDKSSGIVGISFSLSMCLLWKCSPAL